MRSKVNNIYLYMKGDVHMKFFSFLLIFALLVVLSPSKEEDDKGNEEDDKEKESTEPIDLVSGEPEWVRQV